MIKIEKVCVYGWESAIRGMRNPMNSWNKSDSEFYAGYDCNGFIAGDDDLRLMKNLVAAGSDHSKFMRMINATMDITAPLYWWKEFDTYKVGTVRNSCSTMHKIHSKAFDTCDFSCERMCEASLVQFESTIHLLNYFRDLFNDTKDKDWWWQMVQLLPSSYNQRATVQMNYAVLRNMYHARKNHKLDEWRDFCKWIERELPYSELITE